MKQEQCPVCLQPYNSTRNAKQCQCPNIHFMCKQCLSTMISSGMPRRCPECREQLTINPSRIRAALHLQLTSIWSIRRNQRNDQPSINDPADGQVRLIRNVIEPIEAGERVRMPPSLSCSCVNETIFALVLAGYLWAVVVMNIVYFLRQGGYYSMVLLYVLVVQVYQYMRLVGLRTSVLRQSLIHQLFLFMFDESRMFSSIATGFFYSINLFVAYCAYFISYTLDKPSNLTIPIIVVNICQFILSTLFYQRVRESVEALDNLCLFLGGRFSKAFSVVLGLYGMVEFVITTYIFVVCLWPILLGTTVPTIVAWGVVVCGSQMVVGRWGTVLCLPGIAAVLVKTQPLSTEKIICAKLLIFARYFASPIIIGWIVGASCNILLCLDPYTPLNSALIRSGFILSLLSPLTLTFTSTLTPNL